MFKNRSVNSFVGLAIAVLAVLTIGTIAFSQRNAVPMGATNASAEQDKRMVMQELERERLDQLNANSFSLPPAVPALTDPRSTDH